MKKCYDCKTEFEVNPNARYIRKYCVKCGKKRKKIWDNQWKIKFSSLADD